MSKKWYTYFVSVDEGQPQTDAPPAEGATTPNAAQTIAEIAASVNVAPKFEKPVANPSSFTEVYQAAEIPAPPGGFTVFKVADMLKSDHIRTLPVEIKRSSVLLALDAAGVKLQDVIEDAVRRDKALDAFERVQQRALEKLEADKAGENKKLQQEADRVLNELRAKIQANNDQVAKERERMQGWLLQKQQEEQRIFDAVSPFVTPNPITTGPVGPAPSPPPDSEKKTS
jgi:hypothetical protein